MAMLMPLYTLWCLAVTCEYKINVLCILTELFSKQGTNGIEYTSKARSLIVLIRWGTYYYSCVNVTFIPSPLQTPAPVSVPVSP